jgi:hypothetical protein
MDSYLARHRAGFAPVVFRAERVMYNTWTREAENTNNRSVPITSHPALMIILILGIRGADLRWTLEEVVKRRTEPG